MPPTTKATTTKSLLGHPDTVLRQEFILANQEGRPDAKILPFNGPLQLPCKEQILKLYFLYRAKQVTKYWTMAGFKTMTTPRVVSHITKQIEMYQNIIRSRTRDSQKEVNKREEYLKSYALCLTLPARIWRRC